MPYERLVASDEVECSSSGFDVVVAAQESARQRRNTREKLERLVWMLVSAVIVWFGDGSNNLVHIGIERAKAERTWLLVATFSLAANFFILCHLVVNRQFHRRGSKWEANSSWEVPVSVAFGAAAFVGYGIILWQVYGWWTPIVEIVLCIGFLMATYFVPTVSLKNNFKKH